MGDDEDQGPVLTMASVGLERGPKGSLSRCPDIGTWQNGGDWAAMTDCPLLGEKLCSSGEALVMTFAILGIY